MENRFESGFDDFVVVGKRIYAEIDGFSIAARIEYDHDRHIDDDDCHNTDQKVTGCNDEQQKKLLKARRAWIKDEWFYCGVVLSVCKNGVSLNKHAASLWGIEANYPKDCSGLADTDSHPNRYLTEVANELLDEALEAGKKVLESLCCRERTEA
jgi:hypothetical protein